MNSKDATFAIYRNSADIKTAAKAFKKLGFESEALWAYQSKPGGSKDFPHVQKSQYKTGAIIGGVLGASTVGACFMFVKGDFGAARGILMFIGVFLGGALGAGAGTLVGIGTPASAAKRYGQYLQSGGILVSVHSESSKQSGQAHEVLSATGGQDIQVINEMSTWVEANLERIDLEKFPDGQKAEDMLAPEII